MTSEFQIVAINVGSTSTKIACLKGMETIVRETITYGADDLSRYDSLEAQLPRRKEDVLAVLAKNAVDMKDLDIIVSRGGLGKPGPAGAYEINNAMRDDLLTGKYGRHPSALGPAMAMELGQTYNLQAIVVDPPSTDEFHELARISGLAGIERKSIFHALNQKAAARRAAAALGSPYEEVNLVVAHLGGGITVGAHRHGSVIDCTHGLSEGPFTPERAGSLPTIDLVNLAFSGTWGRDELERRLAGRGGLFSYLGTTDAKKIEERVTGGDTEAERIFKAMAYQVAKDIGSMYAVLKGDAQGIVLTGGLAQSQIFTGWIEEWITAIAPVFIFPGEDEMAALAEGAVRVLRGEETTLIYE
jgi:butyrate kinase